jgi:hypothetical protein
MLVYSLLLVTVLFGSALGHGLAANHMSVSSVIAVSLAAVFSIQGSYLASLFVHAIR